jgi:cytochrome P450
MVDDPFSATGSAARRAAFASLAADGPVHRLELPRIGTAWLVTGFAESKQALTDPRIKKRGAANGPYAHRLPPEVTRGIHTNLLSLNSPDHTRLRRLVSATFTRRRVDDMAPFVRTVTAEMLDAVDGPGKVDLLPDFAYPIPIRTISALLGISVGAEADFRRWTVPLTAPEFTDYETYLSAAAALLDLLRQLIAEKRDRPGDDLFSALIQARDGDDRLSEDELTSMAYMLVIAGHETTVNLIANAVLALLTHPEQLALLRARPDLIETTIEEALRFDGPVHSTVPALAAEPVEIGGVTIPPGEPILVALLAAGRDPARHAEPDRFDLSRTSTSHLAFGYGIHHCVGAPLARLEARTAVQALIERFPAMSLAVPADDLIRTRALVMNSLNALPVHLY